MDDIMADMTDYIFENYPHGKAAIKKRVLQVGFKRFVRPRF